MVIPKSRAPINVVSMVSLSVVGIAGRCTAETGLRFSVLMGWHTLDGNPQERF